MKTNLKYRAQGMLLNSYNNRFPNLHALNEKIMFYNIHKEQFNTYWSESHLRQ